MRLPYPRSLFALLATALTLWLAVVATHRWGVAWQHDYPSYHLPFILRDLNLGNWELWPNLLMIWEGNPPVAHGIQARLIWLTDWPGIANSLNLMMVALFCWGAGIVTPHLKRGLYVVGCFAMPLFFFNYPTGGGDITFSLAVVLQAVVLTTLWRGDTRPILHLVFLLATAVSIYSKMNGWAASLVLVTLYGLHRLREVRTQPGNVLLMAVALAVVVGHWPLRNWLIMGSPFWPLGIPGITEIGADPRHFFHPAVQPDGLREVPMLVRYVLSFFELTRLMTAEPMRWSFSMWQGGSASLHQMMGGLNGLYMAALVGCFAYLRRWRKISGREVALWVGLALIASSVSQSHEMRYGLYVPLILLYFCVREEAFLPRRLLPTIVGVALLIVGLSSAARDANLMNVNHPLLDTHTRIESFWAEQAAMPTQGFACIPDTATAWQNADPLGVYFTGPHLREYQVKLCTPSRECGLPWHPCGFEW